MSGYRPVEVPGFGDACGIDDPGVPHVEVLHVASFVRAGRQAQVEQAFALSGSPAPRDRCASRLYVLSFGGGRFSLRGVPHR